MVDSEGKILKQFANIDEYLESVNKDGSPDKICSAICWSSSVCNKALIKPRFSKEKRLNAREVNDELSFLNAISKTVFIFLIKLMLEKNKTYYSEISMFPERNDRIHESLFKISSTERFFCKRKSCAEFEHVGTKRLVVCNWISDEIIIIDKKLKANIENISILK